MKIRGLEKKSQRFRNGRSAVYPDTELTYFHWVF